MKWVSQQLRSLTIKNHFIRQWNSNTEIPAPELPVETMAGFEPKTEHDRSPKLHRGKLSTDRATGSSEHNKKFQHWNSSAWITDTAWGRIQT